jgi:hypothetical protein
MTLLHTTIPASALRKAIPGITLLLNNHKMNDH